MAWSSQLTPVCDRIKAVIATHASITASQVHSSRRFFRDKASWMATAWDGGTDMIPSGWEIDREASPEEEVEGTVSNLNLRRHDLVIRAWRQIFNQDSQTGTVDTGRAAWRTIVEEVCHLIRQDMYKDAPFAPAVGIQPLQAPTVDVDEHQEIHDTHVHYVEIRLSVVERIVWP